MSTITSANSVFMIAVERLYNVPVQVLGFSVDDAFMISDIDMAETMMGVDGRMSAGWVPAIKPIEVTLQADSPSNDLFDAIIAAETVAREKYKLNATFLYPATGRLYVLTTGYLKSGSVAPGAKKVLQPRKFTLEFQDISVAPV